MPQIDLLIDAKWILPIAPINTVLENHALAIHNDKIVDILPSDQAKEKYYAKQFLELPTHALMPGLVNSHTHVPMNILRGLADDLDLMDWLNNNIWPAEAATMTAQGAAIGAKLAFAEMIRGGTTCFNDHYFHPEALANAANEIGIRGRVGLHVIDAQTPWAKNEVDALEQGEKILKAGDSYALTEWAMAIHATYTTGDVGLAGAKRLSDAYNLPVHMHVHETAAEIEMEMARSNQRPLARIEKLGLLNEKFNAVHMVHVNDEDLKRVSDSGCHVVLCPESNLKLASGIPPIHKILGATSNICIGTDSVASNNDLDMFAELKLVALLGKTLSGDPKTLPAQQALEMATLGGAKALHLDHKIGSLEAGKQADFIAVNLDHLFTTPTFNPISQLVYSANCLQVSDVWVAGKPLLRNGELTTINLPDLIEEARPHIDKARPFALQHNTKAATTA